VIGMANDINYMTVEEAKASLRKVRVAKLLKVGSAFVESDTIRLTYKAIKAATKQNRALCVVGAVAEVVGAITMDAIADKILEDEVGISEATAREFCSQYETELRVKVALDKAAKKRAAKREKEVAMA
jgi:predicted transcriptional regulator